MHQLGRELTRKCGRQATERSFVRALTRPTGQGVAPEAITPYRRVQGLRPVVRVSRNDIGRSVAPSFRGEGNSDGFRASLTQTCEAE